MAGKSTPKPEDKGKGTADTGEENKEPAAAVTPPSGDDDAGKKPEAKTPKTFTKAEMDAAAKKAVEDAKAKWDEEKDLSELERIKKENEDLRAANRLRDAKDEVVAALTAAGNNSPELAFKALQGDLKFGDDGKLLNAKDLIESFKTAYPEQFGTPRPTDGIDAGAGGDGKAAGLTKAALEKMTPQQVAKLPWEDVKAVMTATS